MDIFRPLVTGNIMYGLLVGLSVAAWFSYGGRRVSGKDGAFLGTPERVAAYEEIWRRGESELWEWLEERVGMDKVRVGGRVEEVKNAKEKLRDEKASQREIDVAIQVTEEKLKALKCAVEKKKGTTSPAASESTVTELA